MGIEVRHEPRAFETLLDTDIGLQSNIIVKALPI